MSHPPRVTRPFKIKIEHGENTREEELSVLSDRIAQTLRDRLKIRPNLQLVRPGPLEKSTRKDPIFEKTYQQKHLSCPFASSTHWAVVTPKIEDEG